MHFGFLHGESIVFGMLIAALFFWAGAGALFVWKWRYLINHRLVVVVGYLLLVIPPCLLILSHDSDFLGFILGTAFTLPWSFFVPELLLQVSEGRGLAASLFLCALLNAAVFYCGASLLKVRNVR